MGQNKSFTLTMQIGKAGLAPMDAVKRIVAVDITSNPWTKHLVLETHSHIKTISHISDAFDAVIGQAIARNEIFFPLCWGFKKHKFLQDTAKVNNKGWYCRKCGCH